MTGARSHPPSRFNRVIFAIADWLTPWKTLMLMLFVCASVLLGCSGGQSLDVIQVPSTPPIVEAPPGASYSLELRDAAGGALITETLNISFSGAAVQDSTGARLSSITTTVGFVAFSTPAGVTSGAVTVVAGNRVLGWNESGTTINVVASSRIAVEVLRLINPARAMAINAGSAALAISTVATTLINGITAQTVTVAAPNRTVLNDEGSTVSMGVSKLTIPPVVRATTASGAPAVGAVRVSAVTYSSVR